MREGEGGFVIHMKADNTDSAQRSYREWVQQKTMDTGIEGEGTARQRIKTIRDNCHLKSFKKTMKRLHGEGRQSWRFWSRLALGCLPTHSQMAKYAQGSEEGACATVYQESIGEQGKCIRCGHAKETTEHAIRTCPEVRERWDRLGVRLDRIWCEAGQEWGKENWLEEGGEDQGEWQPMMAATGMVPKGVRKRMQTQQPKIQKLIDYTAELMLQTAEEAWESRNEAVMAWVEDNPELKERKQQANRNRWKTEP